MPAYRDLADLFTCDQEPHVGVHKVLRSSATGVESRRSVRHGSRCYFLVVDNPEPGSGYWSQGRLHL
jgi:hypothetical protein